MSTYFQQARPEMLRFVPSDTQTLLDVGCGEGFFGSAVKEMIPTCETWGIELAVAAASAAATRNDKIINGAFGSCEDLPANYFDVVVMNDVLEHLPFPEPALDVVRRLLKPSGLFVMSIPNVRFFVVVSDLLLRGDWEYKDFGILDRTHLRFFTKKSIANLLKQNDFSIERLVGINSEKLKLHHKLLFALAPRNFTDMKFPQFAVVSRPAVNTAA